MKIKLLSLAFFSGLMGLTSCNLDNDPENNYQQIPYSVCNLVIPAQGESFATQGNYILTYYFTEGTMNVSTNDLSLGVGKVDFVTSGMPYEVKSYTVNGNEYREVVNFKGGIFNQGNVTVSDLKGYTSQLFYFAPTIELPNAWEYPKSFNIPLIMQYTLNQEYMVKTFMQDAIYSGTTTLTTISPAANTFSNDGVLYRVYFKAGLNKADVIFYNAKFAENMPVTVNFVLKDLNVNYTKTGYSISSTPGQNIIPQMIAKDGLTPYPTYQFTTFMLNNSSDDLTEANITYMIDMIRTGDDGTETVMAKYNGSFSGAYVQDGQNK